MKITRILPKPLAKAWQEYDIRQLETKYEYHEMMARGIEQLLAEAKEEMSKLQED